jgi:transcriptional adapter 3
MPPLQSGKSQKGTGKKGRDVRQSRSRNTTPSLVSAGAQGEAGYTAYLDLPIAQFRTADDITEHYGSTIPSSKDLEALLDRLKRLVEVVEIRGAVCDKGMRILAQTRKDRLEEIETERQDTERKIRDAAEEEERGRNKANKVKKRKELSSTREERPLTHGAHGLAPQDGSNIGKKFTHSVIMRFLHELLLISNI